MDKELKGRISNMKEEECEELDVRAASVIRLCLTKNIIANVQKMMTTKELWEKLKGIYHAKGISNMLLLKDKFHNLRMGHDIKLFYHLRNIMKLFVY